MEALPTNAEALAAERKTPASKREIDATHMEVLPTNAEALAAITVTSTAFRVIEAMNSAIYQPQS